MAVSASNSTHNKTVPDTISKVQLPGMVVTSIRPSKGGRGWYYFSQGGGYLSKSRVLFSESFLWWGVLFQLLGAVRNGIRAPNVVGGDITSLSVMEGGVFRFPFAHY